MSDNISTEEYEVNKRRRRFLIGATTVVATPGVVALAYPFLNSMSPSARALAAGAPVKVDLSKLELGQLLRVIWQGKPVWVVNRSQEMLDRLASQDALLRDPGSLVAAQQPAYAVNPWRSRKPEILVLIGICTHLGCSPTYRPEVSPADLGPEWVGGWYCPCHGSRFDMAGRVYKNVPAVTNLFVPPYRFLDDQTLIIGEDEELA